MHFQYHFENNKSHTDCPGIESLPLRWKIASDCPRCDAAEIIILILKLIIIIIIIIIIQFSQYLLTCRPVSTNTQYKDTNKIQKEHKDTKQNTKQAKQKQYGRIKAT
jgi:hypothetical protein